MNYDEIEKVLGFIDHLLNEHGDLTYEERQNFKETKMIDKFLLGLSERLQEQQRNLDK